MTRNARLRLAEDFDKVGNRQVAVGKQCKQAQTRVLAGCAQQFDGIVQGKGGTGKHALLQIR